MMTFTRSTLLIPSISGKKIEAWLYKPATSEPTPVIIMGAGIGLVKAGGLSPFAEAFANEGYSAITLDYLSFGGSEGTPRNVVSVPQQTQDFRDVITYAKSQKDFDNDKVVIWGTSFGGMHVTSLMASDQTLAAGVIQCPCVDGFVATLMIPLSRTIPMTVLAILDIIGSWFGLSPIYVTTAAKEKSSELAVLKAHDVEEGWTRLMPDDSSPFINHIAARSALSVFFNRPARHAQKATKPFLVVATENDTVAPLEAALKVSREAQKGELVVVKGGHFDVYKGGLGFEKNIEAQLEFLKRNVPVAKASGGNNIRSRRTVER